MHLSKESLVRSDGRRVFGQLGTLQGTLQVSLDVPPGGQSAGMGRVIHEAPVISLSQEHGVIESTPEICAELQIGDLVMIWPVHSCLMCDLQPDFTLLPKLSDTAP